MQSSASVSLSHIQNRGQLHTVEGVGLDHRIMRLIEEGETRAGFGWHRQAIVADHIAREAGRAAEAERDHIGVGDFAQHGGAIGRFEHIGHVAGRADIGDADRHFVEHRVQQRADEDSRIERHRLARFEDDLRAGIFGGVLEKLHQFLALVIGTGDCGDRRPC